MSLFKISPKTLILGGIVIAAAAGALRNRDKVAGLLGARSSAPEPPRPEPVEPRPVAPSNFDLTGPAANPATHVPAPEPRVRAEDGSIDERAEEEAAAAEAAAIGGPRPEYPGFALGEKADESFRPLEEAGEGESEGEELAEFDLIDEAEPRAGDPSDAERQVEEAIEAAGNPYLGELDEVLATHEPDVEREEDELLATTADESDDALVSIAKDDDDPSNDGVRDISGANGTREGKAPGLGFAGGKVAEPEEEAEAPEINPDQTSLLEDVEEDAGTASESEPESPKETPAAEKSSAVWQPPTSSDPASSEDEDDGDDGGSEWQTWSGRAIK